MRFRPEQHVRRQNDFREAREKGRRLECGAFTLWYHFRQPSVATAPGALPFSGARVGVIASTSAVGPAHDRARAKRRLREVFRKHQNLVPAGVDLLLVSRRNVLSWEFSQIEQKFVDACRRAFQC